MGLEVGDLVLVTTNYGVNGKRVSYFDVIPQEVIVVSRSYAGRKGVEVRSVAEQRTQFIFWYQLDSAKELSPDEFV